MDEEAIKKKGIKPLQEILHQVADMFPVTESAFRKRTALQSKDEEDLSETILYLAKIGVPALVSCGAVADDKDPDVVVVQCSPPYSIGLPAKDYYSDDDVMQKYEDAVAQVIDNIHPDHENSTLLARWMGSGRQSVAAQGRSADFAHDVVEFEKHLAVASPDAEDRDDVTVSFVVSSIHCLSIHTNVFQKYYNPMPLKDADRLSPQIRLSHIIKNLAPSQVKTDRLIVMSPSYMKSLSSILSSTSKDVLQTYFVWKVIQAYSSVIEADELKPYSRFSNELQGKV
jgi:endothelin-converting enzyme